MTLELLQNYWWVIVSILGGILVFLLFVQGGQTLLQFTPDPQWGQMIVNAIGRKWELTFTTMVTFGGAAFASFPLFYSTSFGGAYWLWILILFSFVLQAVSYEYRKKPGNLLGTRTYDIFLFLNGSVGCVLLGVAVGMFFFGGEFSVERQSLLDGGSPVISRWDNPTHGFEVIFSWRNLVLGFAVLFLARVLSILYVMNATVTPEKFRQWLMKRLWVNTGIFLIFFLGFLAILLTTPGLTVLSSTPLGSMVVETPFKYWHNLISSPANLVLLLLGVACVLLGILATLFRKNFSQGIWYAGIGTFFTVVALFWLAGFGDTPFLPSTTSPESSLTIRNASSSEFTLKCMAWVTILVPFVIGYICYVLRMIDKKKITEADIRTSDH
ncbi:MAG: cytochrome d ubiquinol oxidase subunit II [Muribaculaceae bacterium]|nr:cytochrome d ubiquinol oxidase subunit II [Muribaculaceae bacterium]